MSEQPHFVYSAFTADRRCLYVGCTGNVERRMKEHRLYSGWPALMGHLLVAALRTPTRCDVGEARIWWG